MQNDWGNRGLRSRIASRKIYLAGLLIRAQCHQRLLILSDTASEVGSLASRQAEWWNASIEPRELQWFRRGVRGWSAEQAEQINKFLVVESVGPGMVADLSADLGGLDAGRHCQRLVGTDRCRRTGLSRSSR